MLTAPSAIVETTHKNARYAELNDSALPSTPLVDAIRAQRLSALTADDVRSLLTRSAFRAWLAEQRPTRIVGECQLPAACPVYQYLTYHGVPGADVTSQNVEWTGQWFEPMMFNRIVSPGWLYAFVRLLDATHGRGKYVTAADCLAVLDRLDDEWAFGSSGGSLVA